MVKGKLSGMVKFLYPVFSEIRQIIKGREVSYIVGRTDSNHNSVISVSLLFVLIVTLINRSNKVLNIIKPYKLRLLYEHLYDCFIAMNISKPSIIISTAYLLKSTKKNRRLGGINIFCAGNPDDYEINKLLNDEMVKHKIVIKDPYTHTKRVDFIVNSLDSFDRIVTFTVSEYNSYIKRMSKDKISFIENHIVPSKTQFPTTNVYKNKHLTCALT